MVSEYTQCPAALPVIVFEYVEGSDTLQNSRFDTVFSALYVA